MVIWYERVLARIKAYIRYKTTDRKAEVTQRVAPEDVLSKWRHIFECLPGVTWGTDEYDPTFLDNLNP